MFLKKHDTFLIHYHFVHWKCFISFKNTYISVCSTMATHLLGIDNAAAKTPCTVPSVRALQSTTLTCHFPEDVSQSKKDFTVYHYSDKGNPGVFMQPHLNIYPPTHILKCYVTSLTVYTSAVSLSLNRE